MFFIFSLPIKSSMIPFAASIIAEVACSTKQSISSGVIRGLDMLRISRSFVEASGISVCFDRVVEKFCSKSGNLCHLGKSFYF